MGYTFIFKSAFGNKKYALKNIKCALFLFSAPCPFFELEGISAVIANYFPKLSFKSISFDHELYKIYVHVSFCTRLRTLYNLDLFLPSPISYRFQSRISLFAAVWHCSWFRCATYRYFTTSVHD